MLHHPHVKELIIVTQAKMEELAAKGLNSDIFGNVPISVFETMEDAVAYARSRLAEGG